MMRSKWFLCLPVAALLGCVLSSCSSDKSTEEYADRLEKKNKRYSDYNERRRMRLEARQERTDMWFKRIMGTD